MDLQLRVATAPERESDHQLDPARERIVRVRRSKKMLAPTKQAWAILWDAAGGRPGRVKTTLEELAFEAGCSARSAGRQLADLVRVGLVMASVFDSIWTVDLVDPLELPDLIVIKQPRNATRTLPGMVDEEPADELGENAAKTPRIRRDEDLAETPIPLGENAGGNAAKTPSDELTSAAPPPVVGQPLTDDRPKLRFSQVMGKLQRGEISKAEAKSWPLLDEQETNLRANARAHACEASKLKLKGLESSQELSKPSLKPNTPSAFSPESLVDQILTLVGDPKFRRSLAERAAAAVAAGQISTEWVLKKAAEAPSKNSTFGWFASALDDELAKRGHARDPPTQ